MPIEFGLESLKQNSVIGKISSSLFIHYLVKGVGGVRLKTLLLLTKYLPRVFIFTF